MSLIEVTALIGHLKTNQKCRRGYKTENKRKLNLLKMTFSIKCILLLVMLKKRAAMRKEKKKKKLYVCVAAQLRKLMCSLENSFKIHFKYKETLYHKNLCAVGWIILMVASTSGKSSVILMSRRDECADSSHGRLYSGSEITETHVNTAYCIAFLRQKVCLVFIDFPYTFS